MRRVSAAIDSVAPLESGFESAIVQRLAVGRRKGNAAVLTVKDNLVVAHATRADDATRLFVVEHAEAPHTLVQFVRVVQGGQGQRDASAKVERKVVKARQGGRIHSVTIIVGVLPRDVARAAVAPRAVRAPEVAHSCVC